VQALLKASAVFEKNKEAYDSGYRIIMNQGSSRSSKSFSIMQLLITIAVSENLTISVTSCAFPHLRRGSLRDWRQIMENLDIYDPEKHVKTEQVYEYHKGSYMEFFSVDNNLKVRGPGRDILFINEANLIDFDTFQQLILRTRKCVFVDFNPSDEYHWLYEHVQTRDDCAFIHSTYKDNPFLPIEQVREIENLKNVDENFWRIYGLGERGHSEGLIYTHWQLTRDIPEGRTSFGLDFGYNHPTALIKVTERDDELYWQQMFCQKYLTIGEIITLVKQSVKSHETVYCDSARPELIEDMKRAGIKAVMANKNVKEGIDFVKGHKLYVHNGSADLIKELKSYKFATKVLGITDVPVKINDDCCDAGRYASIALKKPKSTLALTFHR